MSDQNHEFDPQKVFFLLFALTALEVLWGYAFGVWFPAGRVILWGGLILMALLKGLLIAQYFMHFKFEGWIIKGLIVPTPFLIAYLLVMISPDISRNDYLQAPVGSMLDPNEGVVKVHMSDPAHAEEGSGAEHEDDAH